LAHSHGLRGHRFDGVLSRGVLDMALRHGSRQPPRLGSCIFVLHCLVFGAVLRCAPFPSPGSPPAGLAARRERMASGLQPRQPFDEVAEPGCRKGIIDSIAWMCGLHYAAFPQLHWMGIGTGEGRCGLPRLARSGSSSRCRVGCSSGDMPRLISIAWSAGRGGKIRSKRSTWRRSRHRLDCPDVARTASLDPSRGVPGRHCPPAVKPIILSLRGRSR
jgi:hypothetical protein